MEEVKWNRCQTPLSKLCCKAGDKILEFKDCPSEVQEQFWDFINNVPFIRWMVSPDRPLVSQLSRNENGRVIIDVTKPPILENSDFFRQTALTWLNNNHKYTNLRPNRNPNSEFGKWFEEEKQRSWNGFTDPSTGMWVTGDYYWMLNYCPMHLVKKREDGFTMRVMAHPRFWDGQFLASHYFHQARLHSHHASELSSRGRGKTTLGAAMITKRFVLCEFPEQVKEGKVQCYVPAADRGKLMNPNQILTVFVDNIDFLAKNTQFASARLKSSNQEMIWKMGYKKSGSDVEYGSGNTVTGVITGVNQDKMNGSRGVLYIVEEAGIFKDLLGMYNMVRPSLEEGEDVFGEIVTYGTAGDDQSDFTAFAEMFYSPNGYNMESLENVFDKEGQGRKQCCMFYPAYMNYDASCIDKDGNSDITKALLNLLMDRYKVKYGSTDINTITKRISQYPITPQEAIIKSHGNMFPVTELNNRLNQIDNNPDEYSDVWVGELVKSDASENISHKSQYENNGVTFVPTGDIPIRDFPTKDNKVEGALEIFEHPQKGSDGKVPYGRYGAGCDPYDDDGSNTMSLGSFFVLDFWTDRIVAEYTGRKPFAEDFYEILRLGCLYYNCNVLYENNLKGVFGHFSSRNSTHLLADTPDYLRDKQLISSIGTGNKSKGVRATAPIIKYGFRLIRDWLLKPVTKIEKDSEGNEVEVTMPNLYQIRNRALLKELIQWNTYGNYDRCVLGDTQIQTINGIKEIKDITFDDFVLTTSGEYNKVCQLHKNSFWGTMYKLRALGDYRVLNCTHNHPIACRHREVVPQGRNYMKNRNKLSAPEYKEAQYLTEDDFVLVPKRINLPPCLLSDDKLYLLGWYIADGNVSSGNNVVFSLQGNQYEIAVEIKKLLDKYWAREYTFIEESSRQWKGKTIVQPAHNKTGRVEARIYQSYTKYNKKRVNCWNVSIASKEAQDFFVTYGGRPHNKDIAEFLYNTTGLLPLIRGLFEGDGHYRCGIRSDGSLRNSLELSSIYEKLIHKVRQILIDEGIWCTVRRVKKRGLMQNEQYSINIVNNHVIPIIEGSLKFKQLIPKHNRTTRECYFEDDWGFWVKLRDVSSYDYSGCVYNIGVENDHSYCANGIVTHNCMSLTQLMLYREEKMILYQGDMHKADQPSSGLENDGYWNKNYPGKKRFRQ